MSQIKFIDEEWSWKNMTLQQFVQEGNVPSSWQDFFNRPDIQALIKEISEYLQKEEGVIYPVINKVFRAFTLPLSEIKVVILGQDPYHNGNAVGLCFSVPNGQKINPSLQNIFTELKDEGYSPELTGDISYWHKQGCLMLNTALTVLRGCADSHTTIWNKFTHKVIEEVANKTKNVAWLLMGAKALEFKKYANPIFGHQVFATSHPSPFSAYKSFQNIPAFIGSGIFKKINTFLTEKEGSKSQKQAIKW